MDQTERARIVLPFTILGAILAISTASILIRLAQAEGMPSIVIASLRLTIATLALAPMALTKYNAEIRGFTRTEVLYGACAGLFLAIHFAAWISSLEFTSVASSAVVVSSGPLWVALLSPILLNEKLGAIALLGLLLALGGGTLIGFSDACSWDHRIVCGDLRSALMGQAMWGNFLALIGAWAVTGYLIIGRRVRANLALVPYIFLVYSAAAIFLIVFMLAGGKTPFGYAARTYGWVLLLALVPQLLGHSTLNWALKHLPAAFVAVTTLGEPLGAAILAIFILNERPSAVFAVGGIFILSGIVLAARQLSN